MSKNQLKIAWVIGILVSLAFLTVDVKVRVAQPIIVRSDNPENLDLDKIVKENLPSLNTEGKESPGNFLRIIPAVLILGGLLFYTARENERHRQTKQ